MTCKSKDSSGCQTSSHFKKGNYKSRPFFQRGPSVTYGGPSVTYGGRQGRGNHSYNQSYQSQRGQGSLSYQRGRHPRQSRPLFHEPASLLTRPRTADSSLPTDRYRSLLEPQSCIKVHRASCGRLRNPFYTKLGTNLPGLLGP